MHNSPGSAPNSPCRALARALRLPQAAALVALAGPVAVRGQEPVTLEHVATFPESFGLVRTVRPLPGGRLVVADPLGQVLAVADLAAGTLAPIGREGGGPGEWRQPDAVYPLPGDSTLLVDLGNARLSVLDPGGQFVRGYPMVLESIAGPMGMEIIQPGGVDADGRVYFEARGRASPAGGGGSGSGADSSAVRRWVPGGSATRRVAGLRPPASTRAESGGAGDRRVRVRPVPLAPQDDWAVAPDGRVAVVRAEPYRVEWIGPEGRILEGGSITYPPVPVGEAERERYREEAAGAGLAVGITVENGVRTVRLRRGSGAGGGAGDAASPPDDAWPETLPAIRSGGAVVAPDGRLWVQRYVAAGEPAAYDLFDERAVRVARVRLPVGQRVVGFGPGVVYVVRTDALGLNWIETYRPPAGSAILGTSP